MSVLDLWKYRNYPREVKDALSFLDKEFRYFLRLDYIASILSNATSHHNAERAIREFKQLRRMENFQQLFASIGSLEHRLGKVFPLLDTGSRRQLQSHMQDLKALNAQVLKETAEELKPLLGVDKELIDWTRVHALTLKIKKHLAALVAVDNTLRSIVTERPSMVPQPAYARQS